jgi:crotonobetainyl-CoA:carnitine CoA-transferase CaiB-like acyl-CoA transferase
VADLFTGLFAANAILAALHHRQRTGQGQHIDVALLDAQLAMLSYAAQNALVGAVPKRWGNAHASIVPYQSFATNDGYIAIAVGSDAQFMRLCECANCAELWRDVRFKTNPGRVAHRQELVAALADIFRARNTADWCTLFDANDIPASAINDIATTLALPQVQARNMVQHIDGIPLVGPVVKLSATPAHIQSKPPQLGEHTEAVLRELLRKSDAEILALRQAQAI